MTNTAVMTSLSAMKYLLNATAMTTLQHSMELIYCSLALASTYTVNDNMEVRGGVGLYSGGNPNVWLSNSFSNDGITNIDTYRSDFELFDENGNTVPLTG